MSDEVKNSDNVETAEQKQKKKVVKIIRFESTLDEDLKKELGFDIAIQKFEEIKSGLDQLRNDQAKCKAFFEKFAIKKTVPLTAEERQFRMLRKKQT